MTGPEHYRRAEQHIAAVTTGHTRTNGLPVIEHGSTDEIALAQVHATLALAAATAELEMRAGKATGRTPERSAAWSEVLAP